MLAQATPSSPRGKIAFARYRFVDNPLRREIWVSNPDGTGLRRVSKAPANVVDSSPSWSPDGRRLVFTRCSADESAGCSVWAVNADGSDQHELSKQCPDMLSASCIGDDGAAYSPDGRWIVYNHGSSTPEIAIANPDLGNVHAFPVPAATPDVGAFAWSPNGRRIAFEARNDTRSAVFIVNTDGSHLRRLTPWRLKAYDGDQIGWSAKGARILFRSTTSDSHGALAPDGDIYTIRPDGTHLRRLTHLPVGSGLELGSFSPNGEWIVFATTVGATPKGSFPGTWPDIFRMRSDGTGRVPVTGTRNWEGSPTWGKAKRAPTARAGSWYRRLPGRPSWRATQ
jgi:Tol biopolymer transport system component